MSPNPVQVDTSSIGSNIVLPSSGQELHESLADQAFQYRNRSTALATEIQYGVETLLKLSLVVGPQLQEMYQNVHIRQEALRTDVLAVMNALSAGPDEVTTTQGLILVAKSAMSDLQVAVRREVDDVLEKAARIFEASDASINTLRIESVLARLDSGVERHIEELDSLSVDPASNVREIHFAVRYPYSVDSAVNSPTLELLSYLSAALIETQLRVLGEVIGIPKHETSEISPSQIEDRVNVLKSQLRGAGEEGQNRFGPAQEQAALRVALENVVHISDLINQSIKNEENRYAAIANNSSYILGHLTEVTGNSATLQYLTQHPSRVLRDSSLEAISRFAANTDLARLDNHFGIHEIPEDARTPAVLQTRESLLQHLTELAFKEDARPNILSAILSFGRDGLVAMNKLANEAPLNSEMAANVITSLCAYARLNVVGGLINKGESFRMEYATRATLVHDALYPFMRGFVDEEVRSQVAVALHDMWSARKFLYSRAGG